MPPFTFQRRGINTSSGLRPSQLFEQRFRQQQRPFDGADTVNQGNTFLSAFSGVERTAGGGFDFGSFNQPQRRIARGVAFDAFFKPGLSGQQEDAVSAVRKNRIARGLRGAAAEHAAQSTADRFLAGNRRSALSFIEQDLGGGKTFNRLQELGLLSEGGGIEDVLAQAQAFRFISGLRTQFEREAPGRRQTAGSALDLSDQSKAALEATRGTGNFLNVGGDQVNLNDDGVTQLLGDDIQGDASILGDFLRFQSVRQGFQQNLQAAEVRGGVAQARGDESDAQRQANITALGSGFLDKLTDQLAASFSPDRRAGGRDAFSTFAEAFGFDTRKLSNFFEQQNNAPVRQGAGGFGLSNQRRGGTSGFISNFGDNPALSNLSDVRDRISQAEFALDRGRVANTQLFATAGGNLARNNQTIVGEEARSLARRELQFLRSQESQLDQLRETLFSPFVF